MSVKRLVLILVCLLPACLPATVNDAPQNNIPLPPRETIPGATATIPVDSETRERIAEYLALRAVPGQFSGGEWNEDVDSWMGEKHAIMIDLGAALGNGDFTCTQLTKLLQQPDHTVKGGDPLHEMIQSLPAYQTPQNESTEYLVYEWRGTHDFLFFVCEDGRIIGTDWWYAGE